MRLLLAALALVPAMPAWAQADPLAPWGAYVGGLAVASRCGVMLQGPEASQFLDNMRLLGSHARKKLADGGVADIDAVMDRRRADLNAEADTLARQGCGSETVQRIIAQHRARARGPLSAH